jgi:hypothetical protein
MYGYEALTGLGGLAAQAQPNAYSPGALTIRDPGSMIVGDNSPVLGGGTAPQMLLGAPGGGPMVSWGGGSVTQDPSHQMNSWRQILDWHNSPAPWIFVLILIVYGYVHVSYRRGRVSAGGGL